jgi:hypothetical protein
LPDLLAFKNLKASNGLADKMLSIFSARLLLLYQPKNASQFQQHSQRKEDTMDRKSVLILERIREVAMMCGRENPVYEQVSNFGVALYVLGLIDADDLMSFDDIDQGEAAAVLKEHFTLIDKSEIPPEYDIAGSPDKYLLVIGDPLFPVHFAVLVDTQRQKPYFSKLQHFGSGFDTLAELMNDFVGIDGISEEDIHFFKQNTPLAAAASSPTKIYIVKDDGRVISDAQEHVTSPLKEAAGCQW